uniref:2-C-methyl-D-erythritol 4-phosphate cytidylyltransferase n=1 Tax=Candidatus Kentrum sp. TC TaxID=2126339 RepID=A0A450YF96_9GAMM|nr:MAG: 2-C-methyl-D-erythritol 4-phosphate cytidylyltransferase [Candidatus Kentron sp. TC]VFK40216.1 MAG: 2-C-methyl-D-erythritol 4-phosphate cytidylyltransferase [Candidatus Kentron sp. TC]VFK54920.1 MAG: 2-C-methyl-D-erythritol 4-phosphate cytidylyltransferase [Candidatus Kentron sp. TC]
MTNYWAVVPAAGIGRRMGTSIPKQYLPLDGHLVLEHTLMRIANHVRAVVVALAPHDRWWPTLTPNVGAPIFSVTGGPERCHSVSNALHMLSTTLEIGAQDEDWVLVHDAARPCVRGVDVEHLITELSEHPVGGLLGTPIRDTIKRANPTSDVIETVDRRNLWRALTPQIFRLGKLSEALARCVRRDILVTDEAQAMELGGLAPRMVEGHGDNIKITNPNDLALAELYLRNQAAEQAGIEVRACEMTTNGEAGS